MPGISGHSIFSVNNEGMRGDNYSLKYDYRIIAVGGSTTECLYLDQSESWPYLVQNILQNKEKPKVFVGNIGKSGHNTRHHYYQIKNLLEQYPDIDLVLLLVGINDLHVYLSDPSYKSFDLDDTDQNTKTIDEAFDVQPVYRQNDHVPFYRKTAISRSIKFLKNRFFVKDRIQDNAGIWYNEVRKYRKNAKKIITESPDMTIGLEEYRRNINKIIDVTNEKHVRLVLMTQPVMWDREISNELEDLLWLGGVGDFMNGKADTYYSIDVLSKAMKQYNDNLLDICIERHIECIDLASMLPKNIGIFYDDVHFNESGAKSVASIVAQYFEKTLLAGK
jgi:lysophospholipase L1-like esterase